MSDLCPGSWVAAAARRPRGRSWGRWRRCTSGWWMRCRRGAAACPSGWWSQAGRACHEGTGWRSGRSSEASESGPSWWDWAGDGHGRREIDQQPAALVMSKTNEQNSYNCFYTVNIFWTSLFFRYIKDFFHIKGSSNHETPRKQACLGHHLIIKVVVTLVHLLQSQAPLVLHVDVRVELPLCGLNKLKQTERQI